MISGSSDFRSSMMPTVAGVWGQTAPARGTAAGGTSLWASHLEADVEQKGSLKVTTAEGDTVTISFTESDSLQSDSVGGRSGGLSASSGQSRVSSSLDMHIQVDGSLDDKEVADISKLMRDLVKTASGLINDNGTKATQEIQKMRVPSSIQSYQFAYQEDAQVMIDSATSSQPAL